jgi:hypothetical protein
MIKLTTLLHEIETEQKCPVATQNNAVNDKHRQIAVEQHNYGPRNPNNANLKFWRQQVATWNLETMEQAKERRCHSCAAFNITAKLIACIEKYMPEPEPMPAPEIQEQDIENTDVTATQPEQPEPEEPETEDAWDAIDAGKYGYCMVHKFKATGSRTCNQWKPGGPVKD